MPPSDWLLGFLVNSWLEEWCEIPKYDCSPNLLLSEHTLPRSNAQSPCPVKHVIHLHATPASSSKVLVHRRKLLLACREPLSNIFITEYNESAETSTSSKLCNSFKLKSIQYNTENMLHQSGLLPLMIAKLKENIFANGDRIRHENTSKS